MQGGWGLAKLRLKEAMAAIREERPLLVGDLEVREGTLGGALSMLWMLAQCRTCILSPSAQRALPASPCNSVQAGTGYAEIWPQRPAWWPGDWGQESAFEEEPQRKAA